LKEVEVMANANDLSQEALDAIEQYKRIRDALKGNDPEWVLPPLDEKARLTEPIIDIPNDPYPPPPPPPAPPSH